MNVYKEISVKSPNVKYSTDYIEAVYEYHSNKVEVKSDNIIVSIKTNNL
jgi:hypothetical protein